MQTQVGVKRNLWSTRQSGLFAPKRMNFPIDSLELYLPLGHPELSGSPIVSKDLNAFSATVTGATHTPPTHTVLDGIDNKIVVPDNAVFTALVGNSLSVEIWIKIPDAPDDFDVVVGKWNDGADSTKEWFFRFGASSVFEFRLFDPQGAGGNATMGRRTTVTLSTDTWYHLVGTYDGGTTNSGVNIYIDAVQRATTSIDSGGTFVSMRDTAAKLYIGAQEDTIGVDGRFLKASVGEVWIWSKELSALEVSHINRATKWRYQ